MAAKDTLTEAEYLRTSFPDLDREFKDGEVVERSMPDWLHSMVQANLVALFHAERKRLNLQVAPELRVKVRAERVLIPDVCVFWPAEPVGSVPDRCPLIAIEILSEDDRMNAVMDKLNEYADWGVTHIWLVNPRNRALYVYRDGLQTVRELAADEVGMTLRADDVFEQIL